MTFPTFWCKHMVWQYHHEEKEMIDSIGEKRTGVGSVTSASVPSSITGSSVSLMIWWSHESLANGCARSLFFLLQNVFIISSTLCGLLQVCLILINSYTAVGTICVFPAIQIFPTMGLFFATLSVSTSVTLCFWTKADLQSGFFFKLSLDQLSYRLFHVSP